MKSIVLETWDQIAAEFALEISSPYVATLSSGASIRANAFIRGVGARQGMLIFDDFSGVKPYTSELVQAGFGYSVFGSPTSARPYEKADFIETLKDWGWKPRVC